MFPELISRFEQADTPYLRWFELHDAFERSYEHAPRDESLIRRIYQYSDWCVINLGDRLPRMICLRVSRFAFMNTFPFIPLRAKICRVGGTLGTWMANQAFSIIIYPTMSSAS